jgi:hypothetical protein
VARLVCSFVSTCQNSGANFRDGWSTPGLDRSDSILAGHHQDNRHRAVHLAASGCALPAAALRLANVFVGINRQTACHVNRPLSSRAAARTGAVTFQEVLLVRASMRNCFAASADSTHESVLRRRIICKRSSDALV